MTEGRNTAAYLAGELQAAGAPLGMIAKARAGYYDDYKSPLATPIMQLVRDLSAAGLPELMARATRGDFDANKEEADAWAASPEGQQAYADLTADVERGAREARARRRRR